jgi:RES domain-containing protein
VDAWRITTAEFAQRALSGEGAERYGGRWNPKGLALVYASSSLSLAILELLVQTGARVMPEALCSIRIDIPEDLDILELGLEVLPEGWRGYPAPASLQEIGRDWIERGASALLSAPSAVVPEESNYLLNPEHPDFGRLSILSVSKLNLDFRLAELLRPGER